MHPVLQEKVDTYTYRNQKGNFVLCWDHSRFVNHSFNSSCVTTAYDFEIAVRDILPGEELTDDYGYLNVTAPFDALNEKGSSRTRVFPEDLIHYHEYWDQKLLQAFPALSTVPQALQNILKPGVWDRMVRISRGQEKMESILTCYCGNK